jgi:chromosome segregation and condensation protein ScpB
MDPGDGENRQASYRTTPRFLEIFGLASLDDLPRVQDLRVL